MALSIVNNVASLTAQNNLSRTNGALSKSLERLSSGLKVNRGADGPAALVISERMRAAEIGGIQTALDNTNKAVSLVQTGEGALNEINGLLNKARSLALDSANGGVNDTNAFAANQAELTNILSTIDKIANSTEFNGKKLLNGQAGVTGTVTGANNASLGGIAAGTGATAGAQTARITTTGTGGTSLGTVGTGAATTMAGSLTISGGGITSGQSLTVALGVGDTASSARTKVQTALDNAASIGGGAGKFAVTLNGNNIEIRSNVLGSTAVTTTADSNSTRDATGFLTAGSTGAAGVSLVVTVGGAATSVSAGSNGLNNQVSFGGTEGLSFSVNVANGTTVASGAGSDTVVTVNDQALQFQIGANAGETSKVSFDQTTADRLGTGVAGVSAANLSVINITSAASSTDAIKVIDKAISDVTTLRGRLGAFQSNTLESNANNLRTTLENTTAAESTIRDTDFAKEIATFTKNQVMLQAGQTVLGNANQIPSLVASLLRG